MTDSPAVEKSAKASRFILPVIVVILLIAGVGYFVTTQMGLDKKMVEEALNNWAAQMHESAAAEGQDVTFAYDAVDMEGGATSRHAVIKNPRITATVTYKDSPKPVAMTFRTEKALLFPQSVTFDALKIRMEQPIMIEADGAVVGKVTLNEPIEVNTSKQSEQGINYVNSVLSVPSKIDILSLATNETITVTMDPGAKIEASSSGQRGLGSFSMASTQLRVTDSANNNLFGIKTLNMTGISRKLEAVATPAQPGETVSTAKPAGDQYHVVLRGQMDEVTGAKEEMPYGALTMNIDMDYVGPLPKDDEKVDWSVMPMHLQVKQLMVKSVDASLETNADFRTGTGDLLPVGEANIKLSNFPFVRDELRKKQVLKGDTETVADALLRGMVGTGINDTKQVDVKLSREKGGSLKLGNMTFEEAMAIVITGGKMGAKGLQPGEVEPTVEYGTPPAAVLPPSVQPLVPAAPVETPQPAVTQ